MTRFYDTARWQKCRRSYMAKHPICEGCEASPSQHVDHIEPVSKGGAVWSSSNWQALCQACHNAKTQAERAGKAWTAPKHRGCFPDGSPRDPSHPWYTGDQSHQTVAAPKAMRTAMAAKTNKLSSALNGRRTTPTPSSSLNDSLVPEVSQAARPGGVQSLESPLPHRSPPSKQN